MSLIRAMFTDAGAQRIAGARNLFLAKLCLVLAGFLGAKGEGTHLIGDHGKSTALFTGSGDHGRRITQPLIDLALERRAAIGGAVALAVNNAEVAKARFPSLLPSCIFPFNQ